MLLDELCFHLSCETHLQPLLFYGPKCIYYPGLVFIRWVHKTVVLLNLYAYKYSKIDITQHDIKFLKINVESPNSVIMSSSHKKITLVLMYFSHLGNDLKYNAM